MKNSLKEKVDKFHESGVWELSYSHFQNEGKNSRILMNFIKVDISTNLDIKCLINKIKKILRLYNI